MIPDSRSQRLNRRLLKRDDGIRLGSHFLVGREEHVGSGDLDNPKLSFDRS